MGVVLSLFSLVILPKIHMYLWICYVWSGYSVMFHWYCLYKVSINFQVPFFIFSNRHCSVHTGVLHMCLIFHVTSLLIFIPLLIYNLPLWSLLLESSITPCIHGSQSSYCTTTVDPMGKVSECLWVSFLPKYLSWHALRA